MELKQVIEKRCSVRQYKPDPVSVEDLKEIVRLAGLAPSVNNSQPWKFIAITNKERLHKMGNVVKAKVNGMIPATGDPAVDKVRTQVEWFSSFFADAPAVIAICTCPYEAVVDKSLPFAELTHEQINLLRGYPDIQSVGAAVEHILLASVDMGYGACWLSGPLVAREELEAELQVGGFWKLSAMVAVGKPATEPTPREKRPIDEIFELVD